VGVCGCIRLKAGVAIFREISGSGSQNEGAEFFNLFPVEEERLGEFVEPGIGEGLDFA
jgi:hypothetical protein